MTEMKTSKSSKKDSLWSLAPHTLPFLLYAQYTWVERCMLPYLLDTQILVRLL